MKAGWNDRTAATEEDEFRKIYGFGCCGGSTHKPMIRGDSRMLSIELSKENLRQL